MIKKVSSQLMNSQTSLVLVLLLGVTCWLGIGAPLYSSWQEKRIQSQAQKKLLIQNLKVISRKDWIEENYAKIPDALKSTGSNAQEIAQLQNSLTDIAKQTGVIVQKTKTRPIQADTLSKRIDIELDCQGRILQLADFIYRMQADPEAIQVQQLRLSMQEEKSSLLRATLLVSKLLILE